MKKILFGLSIFSVLTLALVACSSPAPAASTAAAESKPNTQPASDSVEVSISGFAFNPAELRVKMGTKVTWTNMDTAGHNVKASDGSWGSDTLSKGQSFSMVFDEGTFDYVCSFYQGMVGKLIVTK